MPRSSATHIGEGRPAEVLACVRRRWPGLEVTFRSDDIRQPTDWRIFYRHQHSVVVHLGGHMQRLETELDGFGGSFGPALPGEVWTAPAERKYASHACGTVIHYALLSLDSDADDIIRGSGAGRREMVPVAGARDEFLHQAVRRLQVALKGSDDLSLMLGHSLSQTIGLHLCQHYTLGHTPPPPRSRPISGPRLDVRATRRLRDYLQAHLGDRITLDDLARLADLTTHQFLIAFRRAFGRSPIQYLIQQRLRYVQRQLMDTRRDLTTIALEAGFSSHSHLTSCFRKHLGCCPSAFRATVQADRLD